MSPSKPFSWAIFLTAQIPCGLAIFLLGILLDSILRQFGVEIHLWRESMLSALAGMFFASFCMPMVWRLGLVTMPQYMLGAVGLFVPATILSLVFYSTFTPIGLEIETLKFAPSDTRAWAMSVYIRIARSAVLFPLYVLTFWIVYHKILDRQHL